MVKRDSQSTEDLDSKTVQSPPAEPLPPPPPSPIPQHYRLRKELFAFTSNKIAVQFWYEYWNDSLSTWRRCYGLEDWTFADDGRMRKRMMSGNEISIQEGERWFTGGGEEEWDRVEISEKHW